MAQQKDSGVFPLTDRQQLMWLDEQLYPSALYHSIILRVELSDMTDIDRFIDAVERTMREVDCYLLSVDPKTPHQFYLAPRSSPIERHECPDMDALASWVEEFSRRKHQFGTHLFHAALVRVKERHFFCLNQHHIVCDGVSMTVMLNRMAAHYLDQPMVPLTTYESYVEAELSYQSSQKAERDREYWEEKLKKEVARLALYGLHHQGKSTGIVRTTHGIGIPRAELLRERAAVEPFKGMSPEFSELVLFCTVIAAWMYRVSGATDVLIGLPFMNRPRRFSDVVGLLMAEIFMRVSVEEGDTFRTLGAKINRDLRESIRHGRYCVSERGLDFVAVNRVPGLPVMPFQASGKQPDLFVAPKVTTTSKDGGDERLTMGIEIQPRDNGDVDLSFEFHRATFPAEMQERARGHFSRLLDHCLNDLESPIGRVPLVAEEERQSIISAGTGPVVSDPCPDLLERLVAGAKDHPQRQAIVADDRSLSYGELEAATRALAAVLKSRGVKRGQHVAVCVDRGAAEVTALLSVMRAGGAYVPLDASHPEERNRMILEDARPKVLISDGAAPEIEAHFAAKDIIAVSDAFSNSLGPPEVCGALSSVDTLSDPEQAAYVLFTSGSTGRPKGVVVPRRALNNFLRSMSREPGLAAHDRVLAITTTNFDISTLEMFLPLWVGATVRNVTKEVAMDPRLLMAILDNEDITLMQATPTTWRMLVDAGWRGKDGLRALCGGEALKSPLSAELLERCAELWNMYGPTETTVWSTVQRLRSEGPVTIGRPIDNTLVVVLDEGRNVVPVGVTGELWIGGEGVALGYFGRPELTQERFVENNLFPSSRPLYKTGDLARLLPGGAFECLGRTDFQVKIRGFRIELSEIEHALSNVPNVAEIVVVAAKLSSQATEQTLVAYVRSDVDMASELREHARKALPHYMRPTHYVRLPDFPKTPNGKVDRKSLPLPAEREGCVVERTVPVQPRDDTEVRVALVLKEVLGLSQIGAEESLFDLGATSISLVDAATRLSDEFGVAVPLRTLFEQPSVEGIAAALRSKDLDNSRPIVVRLREGKPELAPLVFIMGVQVYQDVAAAISEQRTIYAMHVPTGEPGGEYRLEDLAAPYVEEILKLNLGRSVVLAGLCFGGVIAFEVARQLENQGQLGHNPKQIRPRAQSVTIFDGALPAARRVDPVKMVESFVLDASARRHLSSRLAAFCKRLLSKETHESEPVRDIPLDGRVVLRLSDSSIDSYLRDVSPWAGRLVIMRALRPRPQPWQIVEEDLGWGGLAQCLQVVGIDADHRGMMDLPHARAVAEQMERCIWS